MVDHFHVLVWIDHREAKVFAFNATDVEHQRVRSSHPNQHIHHKANARDSGHAPVDKQFLEQVAAAIAHAGAILLTGPANAKTELAEYLHHAHPALAQRVSAIQSVDHLTDGELLALARSFFKADDRMHSQSHS